MNDALAIDPDFDEAKRLLQSPDGIEKTIEIATLSYELAKATKKS